MFSGYICPTETIITNTNWIGDSRYGAILYPVDVDVYIVRELMPIIF
jgi:hypothetical protein